MLRSYSARRPSCSALRQGHPLCYEINTRAWLRELSERHRTPIDLANVPDGEFADWQQLGFTHVWLMGVWAVGPLVREFGRRNTSDRSQVLGAAHVLADADILGSPYAIAGYRVAEALGGATALAHFRQRLGEAGLKLVLDFIPNHLGLDHPWIEEEPDFLVHSARELPGTFRQVTSQGPRWIAHGRDPYFPPWTDTAQLDYRTPGTRKAMLTELGAVARLCDGVRCDMAMLVLNEVFERTWEEFPPNWKPGARLAAAPGAGTDVAPTAVTEFWSEAIESVKGEHPGFLFLAEVYWDLECRLLELGFDYAYDKKLSDYLLARRAADAQQHLLSIPKEFLGRLAHFLENHDEPRVAALLSLAEHRPAALLVLGLPGLRLLHEGQLEGAKIRASVHSSRRAFEPPQAEISDWYALALKSLQKTTVGRGEAEILQLRPAWPENPTFRNIVVVQWQGAEPGFDLVAVNLAPHPSQCYVRLTARGLAQQEWLLTNLLGPERFERQGTELSQRGFYLDLPAHAAQLLTTS